MWCAIELSAGLLMLKLNPHLPGFSRQYTYLFCVAIDAMKPMRVLGYFSAAALFVVVLTSDEVCAFGADAKSAADPTQPFFAQHCQGCHAGSKPKGDLLLESLSQDFADKENRQKWLKVAERLTAG